MARNINGLNGRNVMFWKWGIPVKGYIIKYTEDGNYYVLSKSNGKLYEFSQKTGYDTDGAAKEMLNLQEVEYVDVEKYGLYITDSNWREYIDYDSKNVRICVDDILDIIRDVLRIFLLITPLLIVILNKLLPVFGIVFDPTFIGVMFSISCFFGLIIGGYHYSPSDNFKRGQLHKYGPLDKINY